ncbi:MAG: hypothetical protein KA004_16110 [Verrucomicrobiales bacterium]|nr:hypothetical protein [Verrucomicrobiales bacterium]
MPSETSTNLRDLAAALRQRIVVIGDHALRDADPESHLEKLKAATENIWRLQQALAPSLPPQLAHFLESQSYQKALASLEAVLRRDEP